MSEKREYNPEQETEMTVSSFEKLKTRIVATQQRLEEIKETGSELWKDDEVRLGAEAALQSIHNIAITLLDTVPVAGEIVSWGADIAAVIEEIRFRQRKQEAIARGEDPSTVKREKYNLTPDVNVWVKTLTEVLEIIPIIPTHAIETAGQLWYDIPRIHAAIKKARQILARIDEQRAGAKKAALQFLNEHNEE